MNAQQWLSTVKENICSVFRWYLKIDQLSWQDRLLLIVTSYRNNPKHLFYHTCDFFNRFLASIAFAIHMSHTGLCVERIQQNKRWAGKAQVWTVQIKSSGWYQDQNPQTAALGLLPTEPPTHSRLCDCTLTELVPLVLVLGGQGRHNVCWAEGWYVPFLQDTQLFILVFRNEPAKHKHTIWVSRMSLKPPLHNFIIYLLHLYTTHIFTIS